MALDRGDIAFTLTADDGKVAQAISGISQKTQEAFGGLQASFAGLQAPFAGVAVALAGITAAFTAMKAAVSTTLQMTEASMDMSRALGISTNESRAMGMALEDIGAQQGEFEGAAKGMVRQLKENEEQMNKLGLRTRDASGNLLPLNQLVTDGIKVLGEYKQGTDRAMVSTQLFGRGLDASSKLMLLTGETVAEATQTMKDLGLEVGENSVNAWKAFDQQADLAKFGMDGIKKAIGDALLPVLTTLTEVFNAVLPAAIKVVRGALGGLAAAFLFLRTGVVAVFQTINALVITVAEPIRALAESIYRMATGDFAGAANAIKNIAEVMRNAWVGALGSIGEEASKTVDQLSGMFLPDVVAGSGGGPGKGNKTAPRENKSKAGAKEVEQSMMQRFELDLEKRKLAYEKEHQMREFNKAQELAYWQEMLARTDLIEKDRSAIVLRSARLEVQISREAAKAQAEITTLRNEDRSKAEMDYINQLQAIAQQERDLGLITQQDLLAQQKQFNAQRMAAELEFLNQKLELAKLDPDKNLVLLEQLEIQKMEIMRKYAGLNAEIAREQRAEALQPMQNILASFEQSLSRVGEALAGKWKNIGTAIRDVAKQTGMAIIQELIWKPIQQRIMGFAKERALAMAGIGLDAAKAGSGAAASQASIPVIGPLLALGAMAAVFAAVSGMSSKMPSAEKGWDVPSGLNPITQLHESEMVLPREQADVIRSMAGGGGMGGGDHYHINALDSRSFEQFIKDNPAALAAGMKQAARRGFT